MKKYIRAFAAVLIAVNIFAAAAPKLHAAPDLSGTDTAQQNTASEGTQEQTDPYQKELEDTYKEKVQTNELEKWAKGPGIYGDAGIVMDAETGAVLYGKNIDKKEYPASITKILTALLALKYADMTDEVQITADSLTCLGSGYASIGMKEGNVITMEQALYAMLLASSNEVAYAVADTVAKNYIRYMPEELKKRYTIKTYAPKTIIHQKDELLDYFGIVCEGYHRVINEFENGNVFMIERNDPIDFVGEVTILAGKERTSVTIETLTECTVLYFSRKDFEDWIKKDIHLLGLVSQKVAYKLYRSSYNRGNRLFYPPQHLLLKYFLQYTEEYNTSVIRRTREEMHEETGISVKTLNRTIHTLKESGFIGITRGKVSLSPQQKKAAREYLAQRIQ